MSVRTLEQLVTVTDPRSPSAEAYRTLRTSIDFASLDKAVRTLLVSSAGPEEGKSTTLANLAVVSAQEGKRTVVVDCDLRRPAQHRLFGLSNDQGLTSVLLNEAALKDPPLREVGIPGLRLLTSGPIPPNPSEIIASARLVELIKTLASKADLVLFDAPPLVAVADASMLASRLDAVLLVAYAGRTRKAHIERAKALLEKANARLLGAVLTNVQVDRALSGYYSSSDSR